MSTFEDDLEELVSAEDFLDYFGVNYDPRVVHVNRLHILQRFHDYLKTEALPADTEQRRALCQQALRRAYQDFERSDARTERVLAIYKRQGPQTVHVPLERIGGRRKAP
ncbi:MAG: nitrogenase-stabilizing/protective protein NifW [Thiohalomonadaceae bacterium]